MVGDFARSMNLGLYLGRVIECETAGRNIRLLIVGGRQSDCRLQKQRVIVLDFSQTFE